MLIFTDSLTNARKFLILLGLHEKHKREIELLTLTTQPIKTLELFLMALIQYLELPLLWVSRKCGVLMLLSVLAGAIVVTTDNRAHGKVLALWHLLVASCVVTLMFS